MKAKTKPLKNIGVTIFLILVSTLVLLAIIINFSYYSIQKTAENKQALELDNPPQTESISETNNLTPTELELDNSQPIEGESTSTNPEISLDAFLSSTKVETYSAVVSAIYENGLKIINNDVSDRQDKQILTPASDWINISLNSADDSFTVTCRRGFWLKDCIGGSISRLDTNGSCRRVVLKDRKNSISLECDRIKD